MPVRFPLRNSLDPAASFDRRMSYYIVIRGPLGVGKTAVSQDLVARIGASYVSIDAILDEPGVEEWDDGAGYYSERCFVRANEIAVGRTRSYLDHGNPVVFDGNFYWKSEIADLISRLNFPHYIFTLKAPLELCVQRDGLRDPPHGREATESVYAKSTEFDWGVGIDATRSVEAVVREIASYLPRDSDSPKPGGHRSRSRHPKARNQATGARGSISSLRE